MELLPYKRRNIFLLNKEIFIISAFTKEIFIHIYFTPKKKLYFTVIVQIVGRKQKI